MWLNMSGVAMDLGMGVAEGMAEGVVEDAPQHPAAELAMSTSLSRSR